LKMFEDQRDTIKLKNLVSTVVDDETQQKIDVVKQRLIKNFGYDEVSATEDEIIVYSPAVAEIARHRLFPRGATQQRSVAKAHRPRDDAQEQQTLLRERFTELGPSARRFLDGLLRDQRYGKSQARRVLALLGTYARKDLLAALERAVRFNAYSANAVERILAAQAKPKSALEALADEERRHLQPLLDEPVPPRPLSDYQHLVEEPADHGQANEANDPGPDAERHSRTDEPAGPA